MADPLVEVAVRVYADFADTRHPGRSPRRRRPRPQRPGHPRRRGAARAGRAAGPATTRRPPRLPSSQQRLGWGPALLRRDVVTAARRVGACFSITAHKDVALKLAIAAIGEDAWTTIPTRERSSTPNSASGAPTPRSPRCPPPPSPPAAPAPITVRLVVRRVRDANPAHLVSNEQVSCSLPGATTPCTPPAPGSRAGRGRPPPPRDHRTSHRRPEERSARAPTLREADRQRSLARPRRDRLRPDPHRRRLGLAVPRESGHRDHPDPADQHSLEFVRAPGDYDCDYPSGSVRCSAIVGNLSPIASRRRSNWACTAPGR